MNEWMNKLRKKVRKAMVGGKKERKGKEWRRKKGKGRKGIGRKIKRREPSMTKGNWKEGGREGRILTVYEAFQPKMSTSGRRVPRRDAQTTARRARGGGEHGAGGGKHGDSKDNTFACKEERRARCFLTLSLRHKGRRKERMKTRYFFLSFVSISL